MKDQKISNGLLSAVFGCSCILVGLKCESIETSIMFISPDSAIGGWDEINLDTFIRLGKIWAFENGYDIVERGLICLVTEAVTKKEKYSVHESRDEKISFWAKDYNVFLVDSMLGCLEWVNNEVEG